MLLLYKDKIIKKISQNFPKLDKNLTQIILFGSVAREEFTPLSDIDLLIITTNPKRTQILFSDLMDQIYDETCVILSPIYLTPNQFENSIEPLYKRIRWEGQILWKRKTT